MGLYDLSQYIKECAVSRNLGELAYDEFSRQSYDILSKLPSIEFTVSELTDKRLWQSSFQQYMKNEFADFALTLWKIPNCFLDVYVWLNRHTGIHDHHFVGAFRVLAGTYHQTTYEFVQQAVIADGLETGKLEQLEVQRLSIDGTHEIKLGGSFIHQVYHEGSPCVTLCLRSQHYVKSNYLFFLPGWKIETCKSNPIEYKEFQGMLTDFYLKKIQAVTLSMKRFSLSQIMSYTFSCGLSLNGEWWEIMKANFPEISDDFDRLTQDIKLAATKNVLMNKLFFH